MRHNHSWLTLVLFAVTIVNDGLAGQFWHISDTHMDEISEPGVYECACGPPDLVQSSLDFMRTVQPNPDFIIITGDLVHFPAHSKDDLTPDVILQTIKDWTNMTTTSFPDVPVYPTLGNHDFSPSNNWPSQPDANWLYSEVGEMWSHWLPSEALETFRQGGYYSVLTSEGSRVVSLNTNMFGYYNTYLQFDGDEMDESFKQFQWLEDTLEAAAAKGERVYIMGHIPPVGQDWWDLDDFWPLWAEKYVVLMQKYKNTVVAGFFGHEHYDEVRLLNECSFEEPTHLGDTSSIQYCSGEPFGVIYVAPAVAPCHNPAVRLMHTDDETKDLVDYDQYVTSLSQLQAGNGTDWGYLYSPIGEFGIADLSAGSWSTVISMLGKDDAFARKYMGLRLGFADPLEKADNKMWEICVTSRGTMHEFLDCLHDHTSLYEADEKARMAALLRTVASDYGVGGGFTASELVTKYLNVHGTVQGCACLEEFTWKGETYSSCTSDGEKNGPWCYVYGDDCGFGEKGRKWDYCEKWLVR